MGSVAVAMTALFTFGRSLGADGDVHIVPLTIGLIFAVTAFLFPWLMALPASGKAVSRIVRYSEESLLQRWPARRSDRARIDMSDPEG
jgi:hypothetical protein